MNNLKTSINSNEIQIIEAQEEDCESLTTIAFAAKRHWQYPESYYELWEDELTIGNMKLCVAAAKEVPLEIEY